MKGINRERKKERKREREEERKKERKKENDQNSCFLLFIFSFVFFFCKKKRQLWGIMVLPKLKRRWMFNCLVSGSVEIFQFCCAISWKQKTVETRALTFVLQPISSEPDYLTSYMLSHAVLVGVYIVHWIVYINTSWCIVGAWLANVSLFSNADVMLLWLKYISVKVIKEALVIHTLIAFILINRIRNETLIQQRLD